MSEAYPVRAGVPVLHVQLIDPINMDGQPNQWVLLIPTTGGVRKTTIYKKEGHVDEIETEWMALPSASSKNKVNEIVRGLRPKTRLKLRIIFPNDAYGHCEQILYKDCEVKAISHELPTESTCETFCVVFKSNWAPVPYVEEKATA